VTPREMRQMRMLPPGLPLLQNSKCDAPRSQPAARPKVPTAGHAARQYSYARPMTPTITGSRMRE